MSAQILPTTTAGIHPENFSDDLFFPASGKFVAIFLAIFVLIGFGLRVNQLGSESFGEDELNKLQTVREYRTNGLSGKNGEHPFLMKGLQTVSSIAAEQINDTTASPSLHISQEAALRFPVALFGTFTTLLIFLLIAELFGTSIGLVSAAFWAIEPMAIGFDRIAKEDSLVLFFFLLTMYFWVRGQTMAERGKANWSWFAWAAAASFAGMMASKYYPHLLAIIAGYYIIFQNIPATKWRMEPSRWLKFFVIMAVAFLILNPTILLPETWREMVKFSTENRIGHDSYEFMGVLYTNKMTAWLSGVPWTFFYVFILVKTSLPILILFLIGLPMMLQRRLGDGRFLIFFWAFMWFLPFTFLGGKFTRYFTFVEPLILIVAAVGFCLTVRWLSTKLFAKTPLAGFAQVTMLILVLTTPFVNAVSVAPHFRLFTNSVGLTLLPTGSFFPHDEFYDSVTREILAEIAIRAKPGANVACETPFLFEHYASQLNREDLKFVSLTDPSMVAALRADDFVVLAEGRRYFSNSRYAEYLNSSPIKPIETRIHEVVAARSYQLDGPAVVALGILANQ